MKLPGVAYEDPKVGDEVEVVIKGVVVDLGNGVEVRADGRTWFGCLNRDVREFRLIRRAPANIQIGKSYKTPYSDIIKVVGEDCDAWVYKTSYDKYYNRDKDAIWWGLLEEISST